MQYSIPLIYHFLKGLKAQSLLNKVRFNKLIKSLNAQVF